MLKMVLFLDIRFDFNYLDVRIVKGYDESLMLVWVFDLVIILLNFCFNDIRFLWFM